LRPATAGQFAGVAQLVEQLICNHQVGGSNPFTGSSLIVVIASLMQSEGGLPGPPFCISVLKLFVVLNAVSH
jgi:hypothetical protein